MYLLIIILPLLGSISSGFFGRKIGVSGSQLIASALVILTTLLAIIAYIEVGFNNIPVSIQLFRWVDSESLNIHWAFNFDSLTMSMLLPVLIVSSLVHIYSIGYMSHDPHNQRFFSYLSLFTFMMVVLVTADNYLLMFVGWEGVGVCSYLLVNFWYTRIAANQSSISALLTNRVGDCFLTIGMFAMLVVFGNINYSTVFSLAPYISENVVTLICICLLIGAMAKSSQVGLHVWLPMAMEGPTPVSALIHAATMVTAGVYLLIRSSPLLEFSSTALILCLWIGALTTVFSSLIGLFQQDIKKVIAYSTMSQLGMMVIAVGLSSYNVALFHLINHAFYKALLFLGAGSVIHAVADNQDFRKYGGLRAFLPLTYSVMLIASLSLVAFPYMTGFYSKDFILESAYGQFYFSSIVVYFIATIGAIFTTLYSVKVLYLTFLANPLGPLNSYKNAHEGDIYMSSPLIILAIFSIFFGYIFKDLYIGLGSAFFADNSLFIHPSHEIMIETEFAVPTLFKLVPFICTVVFSIIALVVSEFSTDLLMHFKYSRLGYNIFVFFNQRFFIELFYNKYVVGFVLKLGGQTTKILDRGSLELIGPYGLEKGLLVLGKNISYLDTGVITSYALYILVGLIFYISLPYIYSFDSSLVLIIIFGLFSLIDTDSTSYTRIPSPHAFAYSKQHAGIISETTITGLTGLSLSIDFKLLSAINFNIDEFYDVYSEIYTNGYFIIWLNVISIISILSGIFVIITRNPIVAVLYLIALFLEISSYLLLIGMSFIGLSYLLVYIGAVSILFLFILMLINIRISELHTDNNNSLILGLIVSVVFYLPVYNTLIPSNNSGFNLSNFVFISSSEKWDGNLAPLTEISTIGNLIYSSHSMWLMVAAVILLLAMVGSIVITVNPTNYPRSHPFVSSSNLSAIGGTWQLELHRIIDIQDAMFYLSLIIIGLSYMSFCYYYDRESLQWKWPWQWNIDLSYESLLVAIPIIITTIFFLMAFPPSIALHLMEEDSALNPRQTDYLEQDVSFLFSPDWSSFFKDSEGSFLSGFVKEIQTTCPEFKTAWIEADINDNGWNYRTRGQIEFIRTLNIEIPKIAEEMKTSFFAWKEAAYQGNEVQALAQRLEFIKRIKYLEGIDSYRSRPFNYARVPVFFRDVYNKSEYPILREILQDRGYKFVKDSFIFSTPENKDFSLLKLKGLDKRVTPSVDLTNYMLNK